MLIFNGTAEVQQTNKWLKQGNRHEFYMFSTNGDLMSQLDVIEKYFNDRGIDNIEINAVEHLDDANDIDNEMLLHAYQDATNAGLAAAIVKAPELQVTT